MLAAFSATAIFLVWYWKTINSDSLEFQPFSIEYFFLVPSDFAINDISRFGSVKSYYFTAADGPKPEILIVKVLLRNDASESLRGLIAFLIKQGYKKIYDETYRKFNREISIIMDSSCKAHCEAVLALMHYL